MADGDEALLTADDDGFHDPGDDVWHAEGSFQIFFIPERNIDGWLYHIVHQNVGTVSGGCWVWDNSSTRFDEALYLANYSGLPLPAERDLRNFTFPSGVHLEVLDPLTRYRMSYADADLIDLEVVYEAAGPAWASAPGQPAGSQPTRFEQPVHTTGTLVLGGERLDIDCYSMRDHSWGDRPAFIQPGTLPAVPLAEKAGAVPAYSFAVASAEDQLFVGMDNGYLTRDGVRSPLPSPEVIVERDPTHGHIGRMTVSGTDELGRQVRATADAVSPMWMPLTGSHMILWTVFCRWTLDNGVVAYGEIQDVWSYRDWSAYRRTQRQGG